MKEDLLHYEPSMKKSSYLLFTDGACSGNPGTGAWAFVAIEKADDLKRSQVYEEADSVEHTTNNRMELIAVISAIHWLSRKDFADAAIWTDSNYVYEGLRRWMFGWQKNNWLNQEGNPISNQDLWQEALALEKNLGAIWKKIKMEKLPGHHGILGNERCDQLARECISKHTASIYHGPLEQHPFGMDLLKTGVEKPQGVGDFWYLSVISGKAQRHKTWPECEAAVKGQKSAKFKKVYSLQEESLLLKQWGAKPL